MKAKFLALVALVLGLASCQKDTAGFDVTVDGEVSTTVTVNLADASSTRAGETNSANSAIANGVVDGTKYTLRYILQVFDVNGDTSKDMVVKYSDESEVSFDVRLVPNRHYNFVAWADIVEKGNEVAEECAYDAGRDLHYTVVDRTLQKVTLKGDWNAMDETRDAYTGVYSTEKEGPKYTATSSINLTLTRPFAKLRVVTTDLDELFAGEDYLPAKATVKFSPETKFYTAYNAFTGVVSEKTLENKEHANFDIVLYDADADGEQTLYTDYFFATTEQEAIQFTLSVVDGNGNPMRTTYFNTDIPVKRNFLTTITGNVLTDGNNVKVEINDNFNENTFDVIEYSGNVNETIVLNTGVYILRDLNMNISSDNAIIIAENAKVTIDVVGKVNLKATKEAIKVCDGATLTINGMQTTRSNNDRNGEIVADGGIGGNEATININNIAKLTAKCHDDHAHAFGIGGTKATVNINNTTIYEVSGGHVQALFVNDEKYGKSEPEGGAAIGGSKVTITNSTITKAEGGSKAAAIGNRYWESTEVIITNSTLGDIFGGNASAAIGGSRYNQDITADNKQITKVKIENSTITNAVGGQFGAGIGSGYDTHCKANETNAENEIIIVNSNVTAQGGKYAAGIGTGFHAAALTGSIDAESKINATSGDPFYKGTYTFAQHIGYGVIDPAREGKDLSVTFNNNGELIEEPAIYATYNVVKNIDELKSAINAATEGVNTIVFGADIEGSLTIIQKQGVKITIEGENKKFNGSIKVHSNSEHYADAALTIKNVNFETSVASVNVIEALENGSERYSTNITVDGCTFTATGEAVNTAVGVQIKSSKNAKVLNSTATNMHSLIQAQSCDETVVVKGCTINGKNGVAFKQVKAVTVEGTNITALKYGIRFDGNTDNYGIVIKNNNVTADQPLIVRRMTGANNTITLEGTNTLATEAEYQIVITNGEDDEEYVKPTGTYTLTGADGYKIFPVLPVAKVGNTEYTSIDEAIAAWTHNTTLTLISNVTLNDVITLKSTEYHILDLGTYTMTAAKGKDAISISPEGRTSASYALDIKADATNPGGITATSKAIVKTTGKSGVQDRPIIRFYNGVFNASNIVSHSGSNGTKCPQFQFHNGVYNGNISTNRALLQFYGGTFNGKFYSSVDSSAYALIAGGKFKYLDNLYGSALNSDKFTIGSSKGAFDRGVYVDDEGYIVVGGPVITEFGDKFEAKATNASKAGSYLPYSSAAEHGLYYTNAEMAIKTHGEANVVLK